MKKGTILMFLLMAFAEFAGAQSYDKLWKTAETARENDLPRTAIQCVDNIYRKAAGEGNNGQMLRALIVRHTLWGDISADSLLPARRLMEDALKQEQQPAMQALWHSALGMVYARSALRDTAAERKSREHFAASLADMQMLGKAKAAHYVPALAVKKDSKIFRGDLLHVVGRAALQNLPMNGKADTLRKSIFHDLRTYYQNNRMQGATLLLGIDSIGSSFFYKATPLEQQANYKTLLAWKEAYKDIPENIHTYIALSELSTTSEREDSILVKLIEEGLAKYKRSAYAATLRSALDRLQRSSIRITSDETLLIPNSDIRLSIRHQAIKRARLDILCAEKRVASYELPLTRRPDYATATDSISIRVGEPGIYTARLFVDGKEADSETLHISRVMPIFIPVSSTDHRITAVDVVTGKPLKNSLLLLRDKHGTIVKTYACDSKGDITVQSKSLRGYDLLLQTPDDKAAPEFRISGNWFGSNYLKEHLQLHLFTDRGIYRPGQTLHYGGFVYLQDGDRTEVKQGESVVVALVNTEGKTIASDTIISDELGNIHGTFALPKACLNGFYSLKANGQWLNQFRIEEYKRPTFTAELETPQEGYKAGDTVRLNGTARTYNGLPVANATVRFHATQGKVLTDSATTDDAGKFSVQVVLDAEPEFLLARSYIRRVVTVEANVTADNGETETAGKVLFFANRPATISAGWEETVCKEKDQTVSIELINPSGARISADGHYNIYTNGKLQASGKFRMNKAFVPHELLNLPSGEYTITTHADYGKGRVDSTTHKVMLFSRHDTRPASTAPLWFHADSNERGDSTSVLVGSSLSDATLFCDIFSGSTLMESRRISLSDSLICINFRYDPKYDEGARITFSLASNGRVYAGSTEVQRPIPDKRLHLRWTTFRSLLRPGQSEMWQLEVTTPDGKPADAAVMATLYDASLDAFEKNPWNFSLFFPRRMPFANWQTGGNHWKILYKEFDLKDRKLRVPEFSGWDASAFNLYGTTEYGVRFKEINSTMRVRGGKAYATLATDGIESIKMNKPMAAAKSEAQTEAAAEASSDAIRKNFAETAFFYPTLRTNERGIATIAFKLPEGLTAWNFRAIAHTGDMNYGQTDTTIVAQKEFMAQLTLPRFLCKGDRIVLPATLRNLTDTEIKGTLTLTIADAATERTLSTQRQTFALLANGAMKYEFEVTTPENAEAIVCRLVADGKAFSDGEEHLLPLLSDRVAVTAALPVNNMERGTQTLRIDTLWSTSKNIADQSLTIETCGNPLWSFLANLPSDNTPANHSAIDRASKLYVAVMMKNLGATYPDIAKEAHRRATESKTSPWHAKLLRNPELKNVLIEETPWLCDAENEQQRYEHLEQLLDTTTQAANIYSCLHKLKELQTPEGGWAWMKGMGANQSTTLEVATLLARIQQEQPTAEGTEMLRRATKYLETIAHDKNRIHAVDYLYFRALLKTKPEGKAKKDFEDLLEECEKQSNTESMQEKARRTVVLMTNKKTNAADIAMKSLLEHTTATKSDGRFFDTPRTKFRHTAFRIPTQLATLEALIMASQKGKYQSEAQELFDWLVLSNQKEVWNICYILPNNITKLMGEDLAEKTKPITHVLLRNNRVVNDIERQLDEDSTTVIDYSYHRYTDKKAIKADYIQLNFKNDILSTASVFAQYTLPANEVAGNGSGMHIDRRLEVFKDNQWESLKTGQALHPGTRVRTVLTVTTERDYDYVALKSPRAAGLSPKQPLSGYGWQNGASYYRSVGDCSTNFFFDRLEKGSHTFTEEFFITHSGTFLLAPATLASIYAPEFRATSAADRVNCE